MKIIKRSGIESKFDKTKIIKALTKANESIKDISDEYLDASQINAIASLVESECLKLNRAPNVEEIQDMIETQLMKLNVFDLAKHYITYRYKCKLAREGNSTDNQIMSLIQCKNEEIKQENSNKNPVLASVQRDYMAGEVSKDISSRILLPPDVVDAHNKGIIHFHDLDYYAQNIYNCCLQNLEDVLQNGTVISGTMIEKPHSFSTACNIASQVIAQVASSQYGLTA